MMLQRQLPVSFRTVASVAIHGTYSRQKTMNEIAPAGVKMLLSSENEDIPELLAITENVLMIASFAESPLKIPPMKYPVKVSPAAVVSTACTL